ncbi:L-aspartate oxidase [Candidatus Peregrinibacteria bacterium]|nr:L-aspartate oxidase [Candidatus Peregrinibacteria bacterium]
MNTYDVIVVGSGISGLNFSLNAAQKGRVLVVTKKKMMNSTTNYAQGGIAAVMDSLDDFEKHIQDTMKAGSYHNNKKAVTFMVKKGPELIRHLLELGVAFSTKNNTIDLAKEGGHSARRIAHVGDRTGHSIEKVLIDNVKNNKNITIWEDTFAIDLLVDKGICYGLKVLQNDEVKLLHSSAVVLATGGIGQVFKHTTNPSISTGDGIGMALRAGAKMRDMEFIQFHPTVLDSPRKKRFLLSEALRGEGAIIVNHKGKQFMRQYDKQAELAPRDIVSQAIFQEQKNGPVYLDISHKPAKKIKKRFPYIYKELQKRGFDITQEKIPVSPAAHYSCGGIKVDLNGQSSIKHLYAFGEVACTGVHGANRLASNSLLEAIVFSNQIIEALPKQEKHTPPSFSPSVTTDTSGSSTSYVRKKIKKIMWKNVGIVRSPEELKEAQQKLEKLYKNYTVAEITPAAFETKNMIETARAITAAAKKRKISLGCHIIRHQESSSSLR